MQINLVIVVRHTCVLVFRVVGLICVLLFIIFDNHLAIVLCVLAFFTLNICLDTAYPFSVVAVSGQVETIKDAKTKRIVGFIFLFNFLQVCFDFLNT